MDKMIQLNAPKYRGISKHLLDDLLEILEIGEIMEDRKKYYRVKLDNDNLFMMYKSPENIKIWENYDKIELVNGILRFKKGTNVNHSLARAYQKNGDYKTTEEAYLTIYTKKK